MVGSIGGGSPAAADFGAIGGGMGAVLVGAGGTAISGGVPVDMKGSLGKFFPLH
jgi:hypothetical protein